MVWTRIRGKFKYAGLRALNSILTTSHLREKQMHCFSEVQSLFSVYFAIHLEIKVQVARDVELKQGFH